MLALSAAIATSSSPLFPLGSPGCPCIDPYPLIGAGIDESCSGVVDNHGTCYPSDYGTQGCRPYDATAKPECQESDPPDWCINLWCYVTPENCLKPSHESTFDVLVANGTSLVFSYETCGNVNTHMREIGLVHEIHEIAHRGRLRVTITPDALPFVASGVPGASHETGGRGGSVVEFMVQVLMEYGIQWELVETSLAAQEHSADDMRTACAYDIALNNTDLCIGDVFPLTSRLLLAEFTADITWIHFFLVVPLNAHKNPSFAEFMALPFMPFDSNMWVSLVVAILYAGYALYTLDASGHVDEEYSQDDDKEATGGLSALARKQLKWVQNPVHAFCPTTRDDGIGLMLSMANALQAFLGGGDFRHTPSSVPAWIVTIGLSFLVLVTISNYTAQVTAFNVLVNEPKTSVTSLDQVIDLGLDVCGWTFLQVPITNMYPALFDQYVPIHPSQNIFQAMDDGLCDVVIVESTTWELALSGVYQEGFGSEDPSVAGTSTSPAMHCETKTMLEAPVYSESINLPVRSDLQRVLSWAISESKVAGKWAAADEAARALLIPPPACDSQVDLPDDDVVSRRRLGARAHTARKQRKQRKQREQRKQRRRLKGSAGATSATLTSLNLDPLNFWECAGVIVLSLMTTTAGLLLNVLWRLAPSQRAARRKWREAMPAQSTRSAAPAPGVREAVLRVRDGALVAKKGRVGLRITHIASTAAAGCGTSSSTSSSASESAVGWA